MTSVTVDTVRPSPLDALLVLLRALKLPAFTRHAEEIAIKASREGWTFSQYLQHLAELEIEERRTRRIDRALRDSDLPAEKTLATLERSRLSPKLTKQMASLCEGGFVERGENLLVFGLPGRGKTHFLCAVGRELILRHGCTVAFTPTFKLVQQLLVAKKELKLDAALKKLQQQGMKALVMDLRGNPGGLLDQAGQVCEKFVDRGQLIVSTEGRNTSQRFEYRASGKGKPVGVPMVVLVNIGSASAAEIVAGCMQDLQSKTHAIIIGEQTFGKGSVQSILPLPDGSALRLTTAKYYTPSGVCIHGIGIEPANHPDVVCRSVGPDLGGQNSHSFDAGVPRLRRVLRVDFVDENWDSHATTNPGGVANYIVTLLVVCRRETAGRQQGDEH